MNITNEDFVSAPANLALLLGKADVEDINILVDYITDTGEGRLALDDEICKTLVACKANNKYTKNDLDLISLEIRRFGGNTFANLFRDVRASFSSDGSDRAVNYQEIVRDVADHLKIKLTDKAPIESIEGAILRKILEDSFAKMKPEEQREFLKGLNITSLSMLWPSSATGAALAAVALGRYKYATVVAQAVAKHLLGPAVITRAPLLGIVGSRPLALIGPVGWVLTGMWTLADMASPAYRVTVPCVIHVAYIRQKAIAEVSSKICQDCGQVNALTAKHCDQCGQALTRPDAKTKSEGW